jgi:ABC-type transport system involved in multi-copper enzyme maturation permease subunit
VPIHDVGYRRFEGQRTSRFERSVALTRSELVQLWQRRSFLLLLAFCWIPAIVRAAQIYVARQFPQAAELVSVNALLWQEFLTQQVAYLPVFLVALYVGAGAIASDLRSGAAAIYLAKPISRTDYVVGKSLPVLGSILSVTLVPAAVLLLLSVSLSGGWGVLEQSPWLPASIVGYSLWLTMYFTFSVLAISSLSRSGRVAGIGFVAIAFGTELLGSSGLSRLGLSAFPSYLRLTHSAVDASHVFFGNPSSGDAPFHAFAAMGGVMALACFVLARRLRSAEVSL